MEPMDNPYESPFSLSESAQPARRPSSPYRRFSVLAVIVGAVVQFMTSLVGGFFLGIYLGFLLAKQGVPADQFQQRLIESPMFIKGALAITFLTSLLGGYISGRMGKDMPVLHGIVMGIVLVVVSCFFVALGAPTEISPLNLLLLFMPVGGGLLGGLVAASRGSRSRPLARNPQNNW